MKEILKKGNKKIPFYMFKMKCGRCGCKYLYEDEDVFPLGMDRVLHVYCPQCSYANTIFFKRKHKVDFVRKDEE